MGQVVGTLAQIPALARLKNPTNRRSLIVLKEVLSPLGRLALHESVLELLGSASLSTDSVEVYLSECIGAFDRAVEVYRTPFHGDWDVCPDMRPIIVEGTREMIESGCHREAVMWILVIRALAQTAIDNDAPEEERKTSSNRYRELVSHLHLLSENDIRERVETTIGILGEIMQTAEAIISSNPEITD